jgi:hypothetical protein
VPDMSHRHPVLARLDVLIGRWRVQPKVSGVGDAWAEFSWQDNSVLRQISDIDSLPPTTPESWRDNAPFPITAVIGLDETTEEFTILYADTRGVHRVYRITFVDDVWNIWRNVPSFNQRFIGTLSADRGTIEGRWETSSDGLTWSLNFELTYSCVR